MTWDRTVLGVDPGVAACGLGLLRQAGQRWEAVSLETIRTRPGALVSVRQKAVWDRVHEIMESAVAPDVLCLEGQARAQEGHRQRGTTSAEAVAVREVVGVLRALAWQYNVLLVEVEPATWKRCLGLPASAEGPQVKRAVQAMVQGCPSRFSEHAADGAGIALAGGRLMRS